MANKLFQAFIDTAKTIAGYPITVANAVFMRDGSTLDEFSENIPHREDAEDTAIEVPNIDADMLNGHPASYYAKQSDLSALNTSVTQVNNKIGNTDVSKWGNSLTGAIKSACDKADANEAAIVDVNSNLELKCDNVSQLPQYTYHFGSFDGMVSGDAFSSLKALRKLTREPFKRGSLISIEKSKDSSAYDTFIIGSTDPDFFRGLCLSYYSEPYYFKYSNGVWTE